MPEYYQRTFNRYEYKYIVHHARQKAFIEAIEPYTRPDPNSDHDWGYSVFSVYWDSASLALFWEKVEGIKYRRKLRFRAYEPNGSVYVEIKQRVDRTIQKRRTRLPVGLMQETFGWGCEPGGAAEPADPVAAEALLLQQTYRLRPRAGIRYRRKAFFGRYEPDLRITFDTRVQYSTLGLERYRVFDTGKYLVDPRLSIMEVKFNNRVPEWLTRLIHVYELKLVRLSKYCRAIDLEYYQNSLT